MHWLMSFAVVGITIFGTEWLVDTWLGETRRLWVGLGGLGVLVLSGVVLKASGVEALTRSLRRSLLGSGIGALLTRAGLKLPLLRSILRHIGIETEAQARSSTPGPRLYGWLLSLAWAGTLVGIGLAWTGLMAE